MLAGHRTRGMLPGRRCLCLVVSHRQAWVDPAGWYLVKAPKGVGMFWWRPLGTEMMQRLDPVKSP